MNTDNDNSFVKQSLNPPAANPRLLPKPAHKLVIDAKEMASRKAKADEQSGGILKSLGLSPNPRNTSAKLAIDNHTGADWEQVDITLNQPTTEINNPQSPSSSSTHQNHLSPSKLKSIDSTSTIIINLRRQLAQSQKFTGELNAKNLLLERELNDIKNKSDGKILGLKEYEELERQFDEQEKLLSGYQRENERSLIELEATKVKMTKMANLLSKVYGPDWEDTISSMNECSPAGAIIKPNLNPQQRIQATNTTSSSSTSSSSTTTIIPNSPSEKLSLQLAQVQLLVQGMERRLVCREAELEQLQHHSKLELISFQESLNRSTSTTITK